MPDEFFSIENHPYKYGYGMLMHTGYHLVDLLAWFSQINDELEDKKPDRVRMYVSSVSPYDFFRMLDSGNYQDLFGTDKYKELMGRNKHELRGFGELDVCANMQFLRKDKVVSTIILNLLQNSFSQRSKAELPGDIYNSRGRVKHERINVQVSHLLNLQAHSNQPEIKKDVKKKGKFTIDIYRDNGLVGGMEVERINSDKLLSKKMNDSDYEYLDYEKTIDESFIDFIENRKSKSDFLLHDRTNLLLSKLYEAIARRGKGRTPYIEFSL